MDQCSQTLITQGFSQNKTKLGENWYLPEGKKIGICQRGRKWEKLGERQGHDTLPDIIKGTSSPLLLELPCCISRSQTEQTFSSHHKERHPCHLNGDHFGVHKS